MWNILAYSEILWKVCITYMIYDSQNICIENISLRLYEFRGKHVLQSTELNTNHGRQGGIVLTFLRVRLIQFWWKGKNCILCLNCFVKRYNWKKRTLNTKCVFLNSSKSCIAKIVHFKKPSAKYCHKSTFGLHLNFWCRNYFFKF